MFGRWLKNGLDVPVPQGAEQLEHAVRQELIGADNETVLVVTAIVGLLGAVAYADTEFSPEEQQRVRCELSRVQGMTQAGIDAICAALQHNIVEVATVQLPRYTRTLRELGDIQLRLEVIEMLVALAAADQVIMSSETSVLRQITAALGLTQQDYNTVQTKYRDRLGVLQSR
jgi:uncharacterized tellurite resistance protein B-like protein